MAEQQTPTDIAGLAAAHAIEALCREAFDNMFHKCRATMTYDQWRLAFKTGFGAGSLTARSDCLKDWADHMSRMSAALQTTGGGKP
jgi:hypothetical protein